MDWVSNPILLQNPSGVRATSRQCENECLAVGKFVGGALPRDRAKFVDRDAAGLDQVILTLGDVFDQGASLEA
jgi:hypothetical protein